MAVIQLIVWSPEFHIVAKILMLAKYSVWLNMFNIFFLKRLFNIFKCQNSFNSSIVFPHGVTIL